MSHTAFDTLTVGEIVAQNFAAAHVFHQHGIDFCCNGADDFHTACHKAQANTTQVLQDLDALQAQAANGAPDFAAWPLDLLIDYVLKIHHRGIRTETPVLRSLMQKVAAAHADNHPELLQVQQLLEGSLQDLEDHLQKEEQVLFPYLYELYDYLLAGQTQGLPPFHCGSVRYPIEAMESEHDGEGERYRTIAALTQGYTAPADACASYQLLLDKIRTFELQLHEHIHLENNIIFVRAMQYEEQYIGAPQY